MKPVLRVVLLTVFLLSTIASLDAKAGPCEEGLARILTTLAKKSNLPPIPSPVNQMLENEFISVVAELPTGTRMDELKNGGRFPYVIVQSDEQKMWFLPEGDVDLAQNTFYKSEILDSKGVKLDEGEILEKGYATYDRDSNKVVLHQTHGLELSDPEHDKIYHQITDIDSDKTLRVSQATDTGFVKAKVLECKRIFDDQRTKKKFFSDLFFTEVPLLTASILITKPQHFLDSNNWGLLKADYIGSGARKTISGINSYYATTYLNYFGQYASKIGVVGLSTFLQYFIYRDIAQSNEAKAITNWNANYAMFSLHKSLVVDNHLLKRIPEWLFGFCLKNKTARFYHNQWFMRSSEDLASKGVYFIFRDIYVNRKTKKIEQQEKELQESLSKDDYLEQDFE